jgi:hypothetical protein
VRGAPRPPSSKSDSRNHQAILQPRRKAPSGCFQTVCLRRLIRPLARSYNILTDYDAVRLSLERSEPCANAAARKSGASANRRHGQSFPPARDYASSACSATFPYECPWQLEESTVLIIVICVTIMESYNRVVQPRLYDRLMVTQITLNTDPSGSILATDTSAEKLPRKNRTRPRDPC